MIKTFISHNHKSTNINRTILGKKMLSLKIKKQVVVSR